MSKLIVLENLFCVFRQKHARRNAFSISARDEWYLFKPHFVTKRPLFRPYTSRHQTLIASPIRPNGSSPTHPLSHEKSTKDISPLLSTICKHLSKSAYLQTKSRTLTNALVFSALLSHYFNTLFFRRVIKNKDRPIPTKDFNILCLSDNQWKDNK